MSDLPPREPDGLDPTVQQPITQYEPAAVREEVVYDERPPDYGPRITPLTAALIGLAGLIIGFFLGLFAGASDDDDPDIELDEVTTTSQLATTTTEDEDEEDEDDGEDDTPTSRPAPPTTSPPTTAPPTTSPPTTAPATTLTP